jgi:hypothetical protein
VLTTLSSTPTSFSTSSAVEICSKVDFTKVRLSKAKFVLSYDSTGVIIAGNHYGTPKPPKEPPASAQNMSGGSIIGGIFPGAHPSSEGKRKRNRSNVEAMSSKTMEPDLPSQMGSNESKTPGFTEILFLNSFVKEKSAVL